MSHIIDFDSACNKIIESTGAQIDNGGFVRTQTKEYPEGIIVTRDYAGRSSDYSIDYTGWLPTKKRFIICIKLSPTKNTYSTWHKPKLATKRHEFLDAYKKFMTDCILWTHKL